MKILIVSQYFWPESFLVNDLTADLCERGHQVTVLTGIPNYPEGRFFQGYGLFRNRHQDYHGAKVVRVPLLSRGRSSRGLRLALNYLSFAFSASLLGPLECRGQYDVIFVYQLSPVTVGLPALLLKILKSAPIMFLVQDLWPESLSATGAVRSPWILKGVEWMVRLIYRGCDLVLTQSEAFRKPVEKMGVPPQRILYFPNSAANVYDHVIDKAAVVSNGLALPSGVRIMFAGNIGVAQDFPTILSAAEILKDRGDIHWLLVGDGGMLPWVRRQIEERGLSKNVHLLGRHPIESMPGFYARADVMLATLRREPIFALTIPSKIQSYLAAGKPIIAALDGEGARIVEEAGAGLTCPAEDPAALADAVLAMYGKNPEELRSMSANGVAYYQTHFERRMLVERLEALMKGLCIRHGDTRNEP
ncbi:MAG: glycosyltransferase WbuB [Deltaproteobacteria bacterium RBG_13_49_15]|nr:MAG: glycosyltransferase WbuB [Deltaproteobacteria bacterium RBG_13_49_15]